MCNYRELNQCKITNEVCPWVYWCNKIATWKELPKTPNVCKVSTTAKLPKGYYEVAFEKNGYLYVRVENQTVKVLNVYENVPIMVKMYKTKNNEWKLRK